MSGQTKSFSEKQKLVDDFNARIRPYEEHENLRFDLRGYAKYLKEHGMHGKEVSAEIIKITIFPVQMQRICTMECWQRS